jgi:hypothetical protein
LSVKVIPGGSAPVRVIAGVPNPVDLTVNDAATPTGNVTEDALVNTGAWRTVRVKVCDLSGATPFAAVKDTT